MIKKDDLLGLVVEVGEIPLESAARKLGADEKQVLDLAYELEKEGWIEKVDRGLNNPKLIPKREAFKRMHVMAESEIKRSIGEIKETKEEKIESKKKIFDNIAIIRESALKNAADLIFITFIVISLYTFDSFLRDINENILFFVIGILSLSISLFVYITHKKRLRFYRVVVLLGPFVRQEQNQIMKIAYFVLSIAFFGRFILDPGHYVYNLLIGSIFLAMMLVQYQEHLKASKKKRIVVGIALMIVSVSLVIKFFLGLLFFEFVKFDIMYGVLMWLLVKNQRNYFSIGPKTLEFMIRDVAQERPEDRSERFY